MIAWVQKNVYLAVGIGILLLLLAAAAGTVKSQATRIGKLETRLDGVETERDQALTTLGAKEKELTVLREAHASALAVIRLGEQDAVAVAQLKTDLQRATREAAFLRTQRDAIYRTPECTELADLDVAAACPAVATSLRERAARMSAPK